MKLVRIGTPGTEQPALIDTEGTPRALAGVIPDLAEDALGSDTLDRLRAINPASLPELDPDQRLGPPIARVGKIVCVARNYADHAKEGGAEVPTEPMLFMKATSAIVGPNDPIRLPLDDRTGELSTTTDWEVELSVVIGARAHRVPQPRVFDHIAGYTIVNDVSERTFQKDRAGQFTKGKSCDTFAPLGPWLVTADEVPDPQALCLFTEVTRDGSTTRYQNGSTADMVFPVAHLVSYISRFMTLEPGDIIATGTPAGVGMGQDPPVYLKPGDTIRMGVEGLGEQVCTIVKPE